LLTQKRLKQTLTTEIQNIGDITEIIKRRKFFIIIPFVTIFTIGILTALLLPSIYQASTTIMIQQQQIPSEFVQSTVQTVVEESLEIIAYQVMSRKKLLEIIERFDLYQDLLKRKTSEEVIEKMREDITRKTMSTQVVNEQTGREAIITTAFELLYEGKDPQKVLKVANTLASLYMEQNLKDREEKAKTTTDFMASELTVLNENIDKFEKKIAIFKEKHLNVLPEMNQINFQMVEKIERDIENLKQQIKATKERKIFLDSQLTAIDPEILVTDAKKRLEDYKSSYLLMTASLSKTHPDIIKLKREIDALELEQTIRDGLTIKQDKLNELKTSLAEQLIKYSNRHPDIIKTKKAIATLENEINKEKNEVISWKTGEEDPDNPAYISLSTQIETSEMEIETLHKKIETLKTKLKDYEQRLELSPQVELEYKLLTRDYDNAWQRYQETLHKQMLAKSAETMEKSRKGQRFTIIDAAILPEKPYKPNRTAIVFIGFIFAIGIGGGLSALKEITDQSIRSEKVLASLTNKPVLGVIAYIETKEEKRRKLIKSIIWISATLTSTGLGIAGIHFFYKPLPVIWFKILRKLVGLGLLAP